MNRKVYIQSAGFSPDQDYTWITYEGGLYKQEKPDYLYEMNYIVQSEAFSVVLACHKKNIILLVTGLKTKDRKDYHGRSIRNSIAWVSSYEEQKKFQLAAEIIIIDSITEKKIWDYIDDAVKDAGNTWGYEVDSQKLIDLLDKEKVEIKNNIPVTYEEIRKKYCKNNRIAKNNPFRLKELACELIYCDDKIFGNILKRNSSIIIAVTDKKSKDKFIEKNVFRGLSNLVDSDDWIDLSQNKNNYILLILLLGIIIILFFVIKILRS